MKSSIVGIVLVRNEDRYVRRVVENIAGFCDRLILCDHRSGDDTANILQSLAGELPHAAFHALSHPRESHDLLKPLAGTPTWVFAADGDEIYDPCGLALWRERILSGEFDAIWRMKGNVLHCRELDLAAGTATGHTAPPSRSMCKLYNFAAITSWDGDTVERLHGGNIRFRAGFHDDLKFNLQEQISWDESPFRCLHLCFLPRSSGEHSGHSERENIVERYRGGMLRSIRRLAEPLLGPIPRSRWKDAHYGLGPLVTVNVRMFFPPPEFRSP